MTAKILVACFADVRTGGGGPTLARSVAVALEKRGHRLSMISRVETPAEEGAGEVDGVPTVYFSPQAGWAWRCPMLVREREITRVLENRVERPDVVLAVSPFYVNAARRAWPGVRIIYLFPCLLWRCLPRADDAPRRWGWRTLDRWLTGRSERRALVRSDAVIVQARSVVEDVLDFCPKAEPRLRVCPTGVADLRERRRTERGAVREALATPAEATVFLTVGHLDRNKNVESVLVALAATDGAPALLWVCGDGPEMARLKSRAGALGIEGRVRFLGARSDMPDVYGAADVFVHAAHYDNFPNVYLEALVSGLPVIGPKGDFPRTVSPLGDLIEPGRHGFVYDLADRQALPRVMAECVAQPDRVRSMGAAARELALAAFPWSRYVDEVEKALVP